MNRLAVVKIKTTSWITGALVVAAVFILVLHLSGNNMEFSRNNFGWNGTSSFFSDLDRHITIEVTESENLAGHPVNSTLLIIAPGHHPAPQDLAAYRAFLKEGNTIFLADDFGTGNEILTGIGSHISILPGNLSSLDRRYPDPYSVIAYRTAEKSPVLLSNDIALNRPAPLEGGTPLMLTSVMSWTDINGDHRLNTGENMGTFPVMATESNGPGRIIVLSDPSIFINSMYLQEDNGNNRILIRNIISRDDPVLIDQMNSRTADASGLGEILHVIRTTIIIEVLILCLLMLGIAWAWKKRSI